MKILAVDPGQKRIGIAISDPSGKVAFPLAVIPHCSKQSDAERIVALAEEHKADLILIGQALGLDQQPTLQGRRSYNLAQAIRARTQIPVVLHDEYETTQVVLNTWEEIGVKSRKRKRDLDAYAAVVLLQSYIESVSPLDHAN